MHARLLWLHTQHTHAHSEYVVLFQPMTYNTDIHFSTSFILCLGVILSSLQPVIMYCSCKPCILQQNPFDLRCKILHTHTMKLYVDRRYNSSVLERGERSATCQARCIPAGESLWYPLNRQMCGAQRSPGPSPGEHIILNAACQP